MFHELNKGVIYNFISLPSYLIFQLQFTFSVIIFLVSHVQHSSHTIVYFIKCSLWYFQYPPGTIHSYYNIIYYIPYDVIYIPIHFVTTDFYLLITSHFCPVPPNPSLIDTISLCVSVFHFSVSMTVLILFVSYVLFLKFHI